jgi:uncharacterized membrane protein YhaH (DUF805 family)
MDSDVDVAPRSAPSPGLEEASRRAAVRDIEALVRASLGDERSVPPLALYFSPKGRIGRATFWRHGVLALVLLDIVGIALLQIAGMDAEYAQRIVELVLLWPALVISIKRWHDIGRSGWFVLVNLVPAVGQIAALVFNGFVHGTRGPNKFGDDPLAALTR